MMNHESEGLLRRLSRALAVLCRGILGSSPGTVFPPGEPEFEPVHGWTVRQRDDYLGRNPAYRSVYKRKLRSCAGPLLQSPPVPEALPQAPDATLPRVQLRGALLIRQESQPGQKSAAGDKRGRPRILE